MPVSKRRKTAKKAAPKQTAQQLWETCPFWDYDVKMTLAARKLLQKLEAYRTPEIAARVVTVNAFIEFGPIPKNKTYSKDYESGVAIDFMPRLDEKIIFVFLDSENTKDGDCAHCRAIVETAAYFAEPSPTVH